MIFALIRVDTLIFAEYRPRALGSATEEHAEIQMLRQKPGGNFSKPIQEVKSSKAAPPRPKD
jgi:hypothetical protein